MEATPDAESRDASGCDSPVASPLPAMTAPARMHPAPAAQYILKFAPCKGCCRARPRPGARDAAIMLARGKIRMKHSSGALTMKTGLVSAFGGVAAMIVA